MGQTQTHEKSSDYLRVGYLKLKVGHRDTRQNNTHDCDIKHNYIKNETKHNDPRYDDTKHNDTLHNDTKHNDTQYNDTKHNDILYNDAKHNGTRYNDTKA
jgi:hypothetical protein